ncbi:MAG TPA: glycosyltransferase family 2 protein [Caulobacteraceae bacterium]|jgi:glycosyltransferase involved in cell wall biosynthesis|nr:glycosyltransferase family 2 protein [Caulobacteraceae bacterium]
MRLSVVTVCRNAGATIGETLSSFFAQTYPDKQMIVVDGASTDDTVSIARRFACEQLTIVSEPDSGLYDAMNKGLRLFDGDAVGFLNADDRFHDTDTLNAIVGALERADICYGDLDYIDQARRSQVVRRWRATPWRKGAFRRGWMPPHPTFYCRREVVRSVGAFDLGYPLAADYDFMLRALELADFSVARVPSVLVDMGDGGRSSAGLKARLRHNLEALASRRRWLGAGLIDFALFAKPLGKASQFVLAHP